MSESNRAVHARSNNNTNAGCNDADPPTELAERDLSPGTHDRYRRALRSLDGWLAGRPPTDAALAGYLSALFARGLAVATPGIVVAAVKDRAKREGASSPVGVLTNRALCAFRRNAAGRGPGQVVGISWEQADRMVELAENRGSAAGLRDALLVRIMSDCLLRVGEASALDCSDIDFVGDWLEVVVRSSKTDQEGRGVALYAGPETARLARRWLEEDADRRRPAVPSRQQRRVGRRHAAQRPQHARHRQAPRGGRRDRGAGVRALPADRCGAVAARRRRHDAGTDDGGPLEARRDDGALHQNPGRGGRSGGAAALRRRPAEEADAAPAQHDGPEDGARVEARPKGMETHYADGERTAKNSCTARNRRDSFLKSGFAEPIVTY